LAQTPSCSSSDSGWPLPWLPGSRRGGRGGRQGGFGSVSARLCLVHAALEPVADPDGRDHDTNNDQYPVVSAQVLVHDYGVGGSGEDPEDTPSVVVHRMGYVERPYAARVDPQLAVEEATRHDGPIEEGQGDQLVAHGEEWGEEYQGHVPGRPHETN
jgi:hypothetical protein